MDPIVKLGVKAARRAGSLMVRYIDRLERVSVEKKGRRDFVSEIDRMVEEEIIQTIRDSYPNHRIIAEESGVSEPGEATDDEEIDWIIDPLDGTTNYLHGDPHFAISIGVRKSGAMVHGIIFDPLRDELFTATRSQGAQLNSRRIRVSGKGSLNEALVGTGFSIQDLRAVDGVMRVMRGMLPKVSNLKISGSAALDLAYVASGRLDGYWEQGIKPWDMAAGSLLVREAGGLVADFGGGQDFLETGSIVAANPRMFNELLTLVKTRFSHAS
jgi:myo-inositol-1(or 4)-monophosphatase